MQQVDDRNKRSQQDVQTLERTLERQKSSDKLKEQSAGKKHRYGPEPEYIHMVQPYDAAGLESTTTPAYTESLACSYDSFQL